MVNQTNPTPPNNTNTFIHSLMKIALSFGVVIGSGIAYGFAQTVFSPNQHEQLAQSQPISLGEYQQLIIGMTITDVRSILGRGIEVSRSERVATYVWKNSDNSQIIGTFENDKLKNKEQSGLE